MPIFIVGVSATLKFYYETTHVGEVSPANQPIFLHDQDIVHVGWDVREAFVVTLTFWRLSWIVREYHSIYYLSWQLVTKEGINKLYLYPIRTDIV